MNSELKVYSTPGVGSTFYFDVDLPISDVDPLAKAEPSTATTDDLLYDIVVVDDVTMNVMVVEQMLKQMGHKNIITFSNALDAYHHISKHGAKLLITDLSMPRMDGTQLIQALRENKSDLPIIAHSGNVDEDTVKDALNKGADEFLPKPMDREKLKEVLTHYVH